MYTQYIADLKLISVGGNEPSSVGAYMYQYDTSKLCLSSGARTDPLATQDEDKCGGIKYGLLLGS